MLGNLGTRAACDAIAAQPDGAPFTRMSESLIFASQPGAALSHAWDLNASKAASRLFLESSGTAAGLRKSALQSCGSQKQI